MPYRLEANENIADGIRRLIIVRVDRIIIELTNPEGGRDKGVHNARKSCKRVRAAIRLMRDEIGEELFQRENIRFRDASRQLSAARDSWVMIRTLDGLIAKYQDQLPPLAFDGVRQKLVENYEVTLALELKNQYVIPEIVEIMNEAKIYIGQLPIIREDFSAFRGGLQRVYFRGRRAMTQAYKHPDSEIFHEWRKRAKYLWYQLEILAELWPNLLSNLAGELHNLSEYLGDDHDLAVLRRMILSNPDGFVDEQELIMLISLIDQARLALEALAWPLGERIYFDPPKTFTRRLNTYWKAWREEDDVRQADLIDQLHKSNPAYLIVDGKLLTTADMAAILEISPARVRELIHDGKLPAEKVGTIWIFNKAGWQSLDAPDEIADIFDDVLLGTREAAERLNMTPDKIRKMLQSGQLPGTRTGRIWVIREGDLELMLLSRIQDAGE